jgi:hypothetical protein
MSNISTVYDTLLTTVDGLFTGSNVKTRIPNPETLEDNPRHLLVNGWGLVYSGAVRVPSEFKNLVMQHTFTIVLTREVVKTDSRTSRLDTINKALLEDSHTIRKDLFDVDKFSLQTEVRLNDLGQSSLIDFVIGDKLLFRTVSIEILLDVPEVL